MIAFEGVACVRGGRVLFEGLRFAIGAGEALRVSGANGIGKSSLLRIAAGLLPPAAGRVSGEGARGWLGEAHALDPELPLARALGFWAGIDRAALAPALAEAELDALAEVPVRLLSTGQRRRAALVPLIAARPPLWLLDEPASGLDAGAVMLLAEIIGRHRAGGGAVVLVSHQPIELQGAAELRLGA